MDSKEQSRGCAEAVHNLGPSPPTCSGAVTPQGECTSSANVLLGASYAAPS